MVQRDPMVEKY